MPKPITIPLTNLKREWKFNWFLSDVDENDSDRLASGNWDNLKKTGQAIGENAKDTFNEFRNKIKENGGIISTLKSENSREDLKKIQILSDPVLTMYVSQLAKEVSLPDDELEVENIVIGNLTYPVPKQLKMNPITVTYYDDNLDTVYAYHKCWISLSRTSEKENYPGMTMNPINSNVCKRAKYVVWENSLSMIEYALLLKWLNKGMSFLTSATEKVTAFFNLPDISEAGEVVDPFLKWHSTQTFNYIFPQKITRSPARKEGEGLSEVSVTYIRVPKFENRPKAYAGNNDFGFGK